MSRQTVLITGANGGIGQALCSIFQEAGWQVIASDQNETNRSAANTYISMDLSRFCSDTTYQTEMTLHLQNIIDETSLDTLINNAATQRLAPVEQLSSDDWHATMDVNLIAPFLLTQTLLSHLQRNRGSVINIASIHAQLTKPLFTAYATSKAALIGLTRSLAVELGSRVRVNAICPAAITTPMLKESFKDNPSVLEQLAQFHPSGCIGTPEEVAQAALYLAEAKGTFLNGTVIGLDGGVASRLHDPD